MRMGERQVKRELDLLHVPLDLLTWTTHPPSDTPHTSPLTPTPLPSTYQGLKPSEHGGCRSVVGLPMALGFDDANDFGREHEPGRQRGRGERVRFEQPHDAVFEHRP